MTDIEHKPGASTPEEAAGDKAHHVTNGTVHDHGHGHSTAAWTTVLVVSLGCLVMCLGVAFTALWVFVVGFVVAVIGVVLGKVLSAMGFGAAGGRGH